MPVYEWLFTAHYTPAQFVEAVIALAVLWSVTRYFYGSPKGAR
jgi:hypothetical protein